MIQCPRKIKGRSIKCQEKKEAYMRPFFHYKINMASPYEKNLYFSFTASW